MEYFEKEDIFIGIMGHIGAGKSTFIATCCTELRCVAYVDRSRWTLVDVGTLVINERKIHLVEIPSFNTPLSVSEIIKEIRKMMASTFGPAHELSGIIYLFPITLLRSGPLDPNVLKSFYGGQDFRSLLLVTTMWDQLPQSQMNNAEGRVYQLETSPEHWRDLISGGAQSVQYRGDVDPASFVLPLVYRILIQQGLAEFPKQKKDLNERMKDMDATKKVIDEYKNGSAESQEVQRLDHEKWEQPQNELEALQMHEPSGRGERTGPSHDQEISTDIRMKQKQEASMKVHANAERDCRPGRTEQYDEYRMPPVPEQHRSMPVTQSLKSTMDYKDYHIALISALPIERACTEGMLDERHHDLPQPLRDSNAYTYGRIGSHNVVLASLLDGVTGNVTAATVASRVWSSFPKLRFGLMVGVGGGVPDMEHAREYDIRLGDVVVSKPNGGFGGVVQYDMGKQRGFFERTGALNRPPDAVLAALLKLEARHLMLGSDAPRLASEVLEKYPRMKATCSYQGFENDQLFDAAYDHQGESKTCNGCDPARIVHRPQRPNNGLDPVIHYGTIASADQVMRHGLTRDRIAKEYNAICFDMEAAGLRGDFPCLVIRGICDYADSHKTKRWQPHAAIAAAAFAKELLYTMSLEQDSKESRTAEIRFVNSNPY